MHPLMHPRLQDAYPQTKVSIHNGAVAGTTSEYMSLCNNLHVPQNSSIVIVEFAVNDEHNPGTLWINSARKPLERLIRKLLDYPLKPAVVFLHTYDWHETGGGIAGQLKVWR